MKSRRHIAVLLSLACTVSSLWTPELSMAVYASEAAAVEETADLAEDAVDLAAGLVTDSAADAADPVDTEAVMTDEAADLAEDAAGTAVMTDDAAGLAEDAADTAGLADDAAGLTEDALFEDDLSEFAADDELFAQFEEGLEEGAPDLATDAEGAEAENEAGGKQGVEAGEENAEEPGEESAEEGTEEATEENIDEDGELEDFEETAEDADQPKTAVYTGTDGNSCKWSYDTTTRVLTVESSDSTARTLHSLQGSNIDTVKANAAKLVLKKIDTVMPSVFSGYKFLTIEFCPELCWIRENAFEILTFLKEIDLSGTSLKWIEPFAFKGCLNLKSAVFPDSLKEINESAFEGCTELREVDLSSTEVYTIGDSAFKNCRFLGSMTFPETLEQIGAYAIYNCGSPSDLYGEHTSEEIEEHKKRQLKALDLRMVKTFGDHAVSENKYLTSISISKKIDDGSVTSTSFVRNGWQVSSANGYWTTYFYGPEDLFESIPNLKDNPYPWKVNPNAVVCIDRQMMGEAGDCTWKLSYDKKTLTVTPKGGIAAPKLTRIRTVNVGEDEGDYKKVEKVVIQSGVKILDNALPGFTGLKTVELPDGLTTIGTDSFSGCTSLANITIPATVTVLGGGAFRNCTALAKIEIPSNVTSLGSSAFQGCSALTDITFKTPSKVGGIGELAFASCTALKKISLPDSVTSIANRAFSGCKKLEDITFPSKLTSIGYSAFDGAFKDSTKDIILLLPSALSSLGTYVFQNCTKIKSVLMNGCALRQIPDGTFYGCTGVENIYLPDGIEKVGHKAFFDCSKLKTLQLNNVREFGGHAVENCSDLGILYISKKIKTVAADSFVNNNASKTVYFKGKKTHFDTIPNLNKNTDLLSGKIEYTDKDDRMELVELEAKVMAKTDQTNLPEAKFHPLQAHKSKARKSYIKLKWEETEDAKGYIVYGAKRKKEAFQKLRVLEGKNKTTAKCKGLKQNNYYKFIVVAYGGETGDERVVGISQTIVATTLGGKYRNTTSVSLNKGDSKLKVGKKLKLKGKANSNPAHGKKHKYKTLVFESSDPTVAYVTKKGKIKAKKKGKCFVYCYAPDGTFKRIKVTVKK